MTSGVTIAAKTLKPSLNIIAAEPELANDAFRSKQAGHLLPNDSPPMTIADGLKTNVNLSKCLLVLYPHNFIQLGSNTWPIIRDLVDDVITVTEEEISSALYLAYERMKIVLEPSAATGIAVALGEKFKERWGTTERVGVILCGGNK